MILTYADGTPYCGGYKVPCGEEILLDNEIAQGLCIHCMKNKTDDEVVA